MPGGDKLNSQDNVNETLNELETALGYQFSEPRLLELALAHRSWCAENGGRESNERLEFLGDSVLGHVIAADLFDRFPSLREGNLAKLRASVVDTTTLAQIARSLGLGKHLLLGKGEASTGGANKRSILADALEAVIGATYLDGGMGPARKLVLRIWDDVMEEAVALGPGGSDHKTRLQELAIAEVSELPEYQVSTSGPDHERAFRAAVILAGNVIGIGTGTSKKAAEQAAARKGIETLNQEIEARFNMETQST